MKNRKIIGVGVFKYDLFPYIVTHSVHEILEDGNIDCSYFHMKASSLIRLLPVNQGRKLEKELQIIDQEFRKIEKEVKNNLLKKLQTKFPTVIL